MSEPTFESDADVEAALSAAVAADAAAEASEQAAHLNPSDTPAGENAPPVQPVVPDTQDPPVSGDPAQPEQQDTFDGGQFNPDLLPPEQQPGWRQLQASYTRKTQELAAEKARLAEADQLYTAINDSANWPALYEQLGQAMQQHGVEIPGSAPQPVTPAAPAAPAPEFDLAKIEAMAVEDPELAPLAQAVRSMSERLGQVDSVQARLDAFEAAQAAAREEAEESRLYEAQVAEVQAQENQIREAFPHYSQEDIDMIYEVSTYHNGDLLAAQQRLASFIQAKTDAYFASKGTPQAAAPSPTPAAPAAPAADKTLRDLEEEAVEHVRAIQAAGGFDS